MISPALPPRALLLDDARPGGQALRFRKPMRWIETRDPDEALAALASIDRAVANGHWVAGAFAFELGYLLEPKLRPLFRRSPDPLIAAGIFTAPDPVDGGAMMSAIAADHDCDLGAVEIGWTFAEYATAFQRCRAYVAAGDAYQINLTFPLRIPVTGDPMALLASWREQAMAGHAAVLRAETMDVFSFSPELFIEADETGVIRARPMKGTAARRSNTADDAASAESLTTDEKQRAENLMIVDLLRNDLARVCQAGSVKVTDLFTVESYPTLHTMTSGIEGRLKPDMKPSALMRALFPCGSVTGAPKIRAMEIIAETEDEARGVYCGSIGYFAPSGQMNLNVAIRTLVHKHDTGHLRMGVGSGIVYDSKMPDEYAECLLKSRFAASALVFDILETMRWQPEGGYLFLEAHLARMARSAAALGFPFPESDIRRSLANRTEGWGEGDQRVRLLLDRVGTVRIEAHPLATPLGSFEEAPVVKTVIANTRLDPDAGYHWHKTTRRSVYDAALAEAKDVEAAEAILLNPHGYVADGSYTTVFIERGGDLLTPPISDGALAGILRQILLKDPDMPAIETSLTRLDLETADVIYLGNSVRGIMRAKLI